jgi:nucleotide-binding universal stress UspA family protein
VAAALVAGVRRVVAAVDGSPGSLAAVRYLTGMRDLLPAGVGLQVDLINVQRGLPGDVASFVTRAAMRDYHRERCDKALAEPAALLDHAGIPYTRYEFVGDPGRVIAAYAAKNKADEIVIGSRGLGTHTGALLGSVAQGTLEHATVPVVVVPKEARIPA